MLEIKNLGITYPQDGYPSGRTILRDFDLILESGSLCLLQGKNGSGKTSLLAALCNVIPQHKFAIRPGTITLNGLELQAIPLSRIFHHLAFLRTQMHFFFPSVEAEIVYPLENKGFEPDRIRAELARLKRWKLKELMSKNPRQLSGGEQKRVQLAIIDAIDAPIILLDEPSLGLSESSTDLLIDWLYEQKHRGKIIIMAEHRTALAALADLTLNLDGA